MKRLIFIATLCAMLLVSGIACAAGLQENGFYYSVNDDGSVTVDSFSGEATQLVVPETLGGREVTALGYDCFAGQDGMTSIKLPNTLKKIGWHAFAACRSLKSIEIPAGVESIGRFAFSACEDLESVILPDSLKTISRYMFNDCTSLEEIVIPANVTEIPGNTFDGCSRLNKITIMGMDTTFTDISVFVMLERFGLCEVRCWKDSWADKRLVGYEDFPLYYLTAETVDAAKEIQVETAAYVDPATVTQENVPAYVPAKKVSEPTLILTSTVNTQGTTPDGTVVELEECYVSSEIHLDREGTIMYDLEICTEAGQPVRVHFDPKEPLILPYPKGMSYEKALTQQFVIEHDMKPGFEIYSTMDGSLIRTKAGLLVYTSSFSPFTVNWEENPDASELPQTGDSAPSVAMLMGMIVLCAAAGMMLRRKAA